VAARAKSCRSTRTRKPPRRATDLRYGTPLTPKVEISESPNASF
jgi:hypothetical protein